MNITAKISCALAMQLFCLTAHAQLKIGAGTFVRTVSGAKINLCGMDLVVYGNADQQPGAGTYIFSGDTDNTFSGTSVPTFDRIVLSKTGGKKLMLLQNLLAGSSLTFISGHLDLNNSLLQVKPGGVISGESAEGHILSSGNGYIYTTTTLNAPVAANPGNLGAVISSTADLGVTTIRRRHLAQTVGTGNTGIKRYYEIYPTHNTGLDATLRLYYSDDELNGLNENTLALWRNAGSWSHEGYTTRNTSDNYVEKQGIASFSTWTLAPSSVTLPVTLAVFEVSGADVEGISLRWVTTSESDAREFSIERSPDPVNGFLPIGSVPAANASRGAEYRYTDPTVTAGPVYYYRLKTVDTDGSYAFSNIVSASLPGKASLSVYPNPAASVATLSSEEGIAGLDIFNISGKKVAGFRYSGPLKETTLYLETLPSGTYFLRVTGLQGASRSATLVISR